MSRPSVSLAIASSNPMKLAEFYSLILEAKILNGSSNSHFLITYSDSLMIEIYKGRIFLKRFRQGRTIAPCFEKQSSLDPLEELRLWCAKIIGFGAKIIECEKSFSFGAEAWLEDPDGNAFIILIRNK